MFMTLPFCKALLMPEDTESAPMPLRLCRIEPFLPSPENAFKAAFLTPGEAAALIIVGIAALSAIAAKGKGIPNIIIT